MALACKFCIAERGLRGGEIPSLPQNEEEFIEHLESVHHMPVKRPGETDAQAEERFRTKHPEGVNRRER